MKLIVLLLIPLLISSCNFSRPMQKGYYDKPTTLGIVFTVLPKFGQYPNNNYGLSAVGAAGNLIEDGVQKKRNKNISDSILISDVFITMKKSLWESFGARGKKVKIIQGNINVKELVSLQVEGNFYPYFIKDYCKANGVDELLVIDVVEYGLWGSGKDLYAYINASPYIVEGKSNQYLWRLTIPKGRFTSAITGEWKKRPSAEEYAYALQNAFEFTKYIIFKDLDKNQ